jgi:hypothetical protein
MKRRNHKSKQGQAIILVTLALIAMCGLMGLAVDLGWSYFVRKSAQAAADAAALSAVRDALANNRYSATSTSGETQCGSGGLPPSLALGCTYATRNNFQPNGNNGRQNVTIEAGLGTPPTAPGVAAIYWVTVRASERIPQLFSAVLSNTEANVAARATAVVANVVVEGSLILINRQNDAAPVVGVGKNLDAQGSNTIVASGGILLASNAPVAGRLWGSSNVSNTPYTHIRGAGGYQLGGSGSWTATPQNGYSDGPQFYDPMRGKGQPPLITTGQTPIPIPGATIAGGNNANNPTILAPGAYFATDPSTGAATGRPVTLGNGYFTFQDTGTFDNNQFIFYGGLATGSGNSTITFAPGRYVMAGSLPGGAGFDISNGTVLKDGTSTPSVPANDAGEIFIFTDTHYSGLNVPNSVASIQSQLGYGTSGIKTGNCNNCDINLHGLNKNNLPANSPLDDFAPVIMWQDQGNSHIKYDSSGNVDYTSCGGTLDSPCTNPNVPAGATSPEMDILATPTVHLYGAVYQPRGAWTVMQASGTDSGPLQIVTGAFSLQGSGNLNLQGISQPLTTLSCALVE